MKTKSSLSQKGETKSPEANSGQTQSEENPDKKESPAKEIPFELGYAYQLMGNELQPLTQEEAVSNASRYSSPAERKFKSENELAELMFGNSKTLFGENILLIDLKKKTGLEFSGDFAPDGILLDFREPLKPKLFLGKVFLSEKTFGELFLQMTKLFSFFRNEESVKQFADTLGAIIGKDKTLKKEFQTKASGGAIQEVLTEVLKRKPAVLLLLDSEKTDLPALMETYTETWGKLVKPIFVRKFSCKGETVVTIRPKFSELNGKKAVKEGKVKSTEEDHLKDVSETVGEIFLQIKKELLKADKELEFRVKQYYISLRKNRNLAFFQLGKKKLSIVVMNPEKDTRKQIKHHPVKTLAESVQKFWNGECCTVIIESKEHLEEVITLLRKIIASRKSEENKSDISVKNAKVEKPQVKPKSKDGKKR